jgi:hypothetical protein
MNNEINTSVNPPRRRGRPPLSPAQREARAQARSEAKDQAKAERIAATTTLMGSEPLVGWRDLLAAIRGRYGRGLCYRRFRSLVVQGLLPCYVDTLRLDRYGNHSRRYRISEVLATLDQSLQRAS